MTGVANVRFQPYRLISSKCYDAEDSRIRCTACHDPAWGSQSEALRLTTANARPAMGAASRRHESAKWRRPIA